MISIGVMAVVAVLAGFALVSYLYLLLSNALNIW